MGFVTEIDDFSRGPAAERLRGLNGKANDLEGRCIQLLGRPLEREAIWRWLVAKAREREAGEVEAIDKGWRKTCVRERGGFWEVRGEDNGNWHRVDDRLWILGMCMPVFEEDEKRASEARWGKAVERLPI